MIWRWKPVVTSARTRGFVARRRSAAGFTLIEVMVALVVIATTLAAVIHGLSGYAANYTYMRDRTLAHWVARNTLVAAQISEAWPGVGEHKDTVEFAGQEWSTLTTTTQTDEIDMRRIDIEVRRSGEEKGAKSRLSGFLQAPAK